MQDFIKETRDYNRKNDFNHQNICASLRALEIQVGQLTNTVVEHDIGTLPSKFLKNFKEYINTMVLMDEEIELEEPINIESDPSEEELHEEESNEDIPMENQIEPNSKEPNLRTLNPLKNHPNLKSQKREANLKRTRQRQWRAM